MKQLRWKRQTKGGGYGLRYGQHKVYLAIVGSQGVGHYWYAARCHEHGIRPESELGLASVAIAKEHAEAYVRQSLEARRETNWLEGVKRSLHREWRRLADVRETISCTTADAMQAKMDDCNRRLKVLYQKEKML